MRALITALALVAGIGAVLEAQQPPVLSLSQLTWFDRSGRTLGTLGPLADHGNIELSPDASLAASAVAGRTAARDIFIYGTSGGSVRRLTTTAADENWMIWSADGSQVVLNAFDGDRFDLFAAPAAGQGPLRPLTADGEPRWPVSLSPDGRFLLCVTNDPRTGNDIWVIPMDGREPYPFRRTRASENWATFSPDGRFVAFSSTESGQPEVFITPFPGPGPAWRVSPGTGTQSRWRQAEELVYLDAGGTLVSLSLTLAGNRVEVADVTRLFDIAYPYGAYHAFDVTKDGRRVLANITVISGREPGTLARLAR